MNTSAQIARNYLNTGTEKAKLSVFRMLLLGSFAGIFIALAGTASSMAQLAAGGTAGKLAGAAVFPGGLAMVVLCGSELFTGNCLMVLPLMEKKITLKALLKNWVFVYFGNLIGALCVTAVLFGSGLLGSASPDFTLLVANAAQTKAALSLTEAVCRGVLCNFLVCTAVWCAMSAGDTAGKVLGLFFPIMLFVVCGFEHSIANMFYLSAGLLAKAALPEIAAEVPALTLSGAVFSNLIPVTLGNIIGGAGLGLMFHAAYFRSGEK